MKNLSIGIVTEKGIDFKGLYYSCSQAVSRKWFEKAKKERSWKVPVIFENSDFTRIHIFVSDEMRWVQADIFFTNTYTQI